MTMTREQLEQSIRNAATDRSRPVRMRGSNLANFDFSGLNLTGADFSFSNLQNANFNGAILHEVNLSFANLQNASFVDADLTGANLNFSGLDGADLSGANLEGVSMSFSAASPPKMHNPFAGDEPITLTTLLRQRSVLGIFITMMLGAFILYGISAIVYFTGLMTNQADPNLARMNQWVFTQNMVSGITISLLASGLSPWLDSLHMKVWQRHLLLSGLAIGFWMIEQMFMFQFAGGREAVSALIPHMDKYRSTMVELPWYLYATGPLTVANLLYYLQRQGRQLTRKLSEQEYRLLNMEKLKTRAELDALQAKINPHFLYNALNSIASLVHEDPDKAEEMTLLLSKLFRYTTGRDGSHFNTLFNELEMVRTYLKVEQVRFGERLQFSVDLQEANLGDVQIPQFLLQPLVENAVKHGISKRADSGRIDIKIYEQQGWLHLSVHDNGPDFSDDMSGGYGLRSIQDKLKLLYADDAKVELHNQPYKQVLLSMRMTTLKQVVSSDRFNFKGSTDARA